jgi:tetratricopeptide (TPR) repeat protein
VAFSVHIVSPFLILSYTLSAAAPAAQLDRLVEAGHWKQARRLVEQQLRVNANDATAHRWLAKIKLSYNDLDGAVTEAERAAALAPNDAEVQAQLAEAYAMQADRASVVHGIAYVHKMHQALETALAADPHNLDALLVKMMFSWKAPLLAGGSRQRARSIANTITGFSPAWGHLAQARMLVGKGNDAAVEAQLMQAAQADPNLLRAQLALAEFYCCQAANKRFDLAEQAARRALTIDPTAGPAYKILAGIYAARLRWSDLEATIARAAAEAPEDLSPLYAAAEALIAAGQDYRRAESYLHRYLGVEPEARQPSQAEAHCLLGELYRREGRKSEAMRELQAALRLDPGCPRAKLELDALSRS